ncbi:DUF192 domain-containing protein [Halovivax limisalsi]|uniref:DUF192 domain-containing protein n=1 Tax=Halovivax limisalsi TaxID=1453760 RepID=UPI001FFD050C|nr:DUF192 domain-containing protein [Halovivax limisalsi]
MRLVHEPKSGAPTTLAADVETADGWMRKLRGLMFRRSLPASYALAFRFDAVKARDVHMLFVFVPLDVVWVADGVVQRVERLPPWRGYAREACDLIVELPAGAAADVEPGDAVELES